MKQSKIFIYALSVLVAIIFIVILSNNKEICPKKECINQGSCPDKQKNNDDYIFMNPLNRFIAVL
jgi:hypothetical protein